MTPLGKIDSSELLRERIAQAIYALDPHYEEGERIDGFLVSPGGNLSWEEAKRWDAEFVYEGSGFIGITKFPYEAADAVIQVIDTSRMGSWLARILTFLFWMAFGMLLSFLLFILAFVLFIFVHVVNSLLPSMIW
jgi:hypothetical protein